MEAAKWEDKVAGRKVGSCPRNEEMALFQQGELADKESCQAKQERMGKDRMARDIWMEEQGSGEGDQQVSMAEGESGMKNYHPSCIATITNCLRQAG